MERPIRVAQLLNRMDSGGVEAVVMNYYRNMDRSRVQFDFFLDRDSTFPQREELERLGAGIYLLPPYTHVREYQQALQKAFREKQYQVVHSHLSTMSLFPLFAAWRAGVPVRVCHNHSTAHRGEGKRTLLKYLLRPFSYRFATELYACGQRAGRWLYGDRRFDRGTVTVLPNAIDTGRFAFDGQARRELRRELDIPEDSFVVGHVGRFTYTKNHGFLVDIFAQLAKNAPQARLLLIGEGELMEQTREKVARLGLGDRVIFTGARRDVDKLYSAMDVFCLPSFYEGMPVVAWEAQANGLPCLFSDQVSTEAQVHENVRFLPLSGGEKAWTEAMDSLERCEGDGVPDIRDHAAQLERFYEEKCGDLGRSVGETP